MGETIVTTGVDALLDLLRAADRVAMSDAATKLRVPLDTIQSWVDFLVEERIVGVEYKFTKPFIYLNRETAIKKETNLLPDLQEIRRAYLQRAREKRIPQDQIAPLWDAHVRSELTSVEQFFYDQAQKRGVVETRERKALWEEYVRDVMVRLKG